MRTFYICSNNSVTGLMTEADFARMEAGDKTGYRIFLFSDYAEGPWICGTQELRRRMTAHCVIIQADFTIPFSNGVELYENRKSLLKAVAVVGSLSEAIDAFGLYMETELLTAAG